MSDAKTRLPRVAYAALWTVLSLLIASPSFAESTAAFQLLEYNAPEAAAERAGSLAGGSAMPNAIAGGTDLPIEVEPNGTAASATPLSGTSLRIKGTVFPAADADFYSFTAAAGDRIYAATQTQFDASASGDTTLQLVASDGSTVIETDNNDGTFNASSSSLAGMLIPSAGTYYLRVAHNFTTGTVRPYFLYFRQQSAPPTAEAEPNNTPATATPIPASGHVSGTISAVSPGESDFYSITLAAGDTVYLSLDMNPERDAAVWNGRLGFALFGNPPANQILLANDANLGVTPADPNSEAFFFTVKDAGTYYVYVDSAAAAGLGANATYNLSVSVLPPPTPAGMCTTYTSTDVPQTIPTVTGSVSSTLTIPGNPRIADLDVSINLNHTFMQDIDAHLISPAGNDNGLFTDIGASTVGGAQTLMDIVLDDEAAVPFAFALTAAYRVQPELGYRLAWFDGEDAGGTWTLQLRDDATGDGGTLNAWSITVCEPPPPPACPAGTVQTTVYSTDFEAGATGFTHSGTGDEWELGLPTFAPITTCNSGSNCWKTDLDNTYNASSSQDLLSPNINLGGLQAPVLIRWAQRYQMESASFDHYSVTAQEVGGANPLKLFEWLDATMTNAVGNPTVTVAESAGWAEFTRRADSLAGTNAELLFHLDGDTTVNLAGAAIDDVSVTACRASSADLAITKTDGVTTAVPGGSVTYTITASNAGPDAAAPATVADTFPAALTCTWACAGAGGGTCAAAGAGNINDAAVLPAGGSVTYTASCAIAASATGTLSNTATVSSSVTDPTPGNNSATDTDTLTPQADLSITKTDGVTSVVAGGSVSYTIVASNAGPSNAPGTSVVDTFPASLTCTWTCTGDSGGTCTAGGSGNISDLVNLPAGASAIYMANCGVSAAASGSLSNTATVSAPGGVTDPTPANNSATDTDTLTSQADLSITKTDGVTSVVAGGSVIYTIVASNAGPSNAPGTTVVDTFPASLTCNWTCSGAGGGTCTAGGSGNISDLANLPAGASATYTANCGVSAAASGSLSNTATVSAPGGVTDPTPANNSATDTDSVLQPGVLGVAPANLDFGTITVGSSSASQSITLSNSGGSPLQVTAISAAVAPFAAIGGSCGAVPFSIGTGLSCTLNYNFSPTAGGPASQNLSVTSDVGNGAFSLSGIGGVGVVGVLSATVDFGSQPLGSTSQLALTIINTGTGPLQVTSISPVAAPFAEVAGGMCGAVPFNLVAGAGCTVLYSFSPTLEGPYSQLVTVTANVGTATATLIGTGLPAGLVGPVQIDTLSTWSSLLMLVLLSLGGLMAIRRHN